MNVMTSGRWTAADGGSKFAALPRRAFVVGVGLSLGLMPAVVPAIAAPNENLAKLGAWIVGGQLGLAALVHFRKTGSADKFLSEAKFRAREIGIEVKDLPPPPEKSTDGLIMMLEYFNKGDGTRVGADIRRQHGAYHSTLYEVSSRMFHMPLIYDLDPALADKIATGIRTNCTRIRLPDQLWKPATEAVAKRVKFDDVRAAVVQMDKDVTAYLIRVVRGEEK
jgi:hypothetical protein